MLKEAILSLTNLISLIAVVAYLGKFSPLKVQNASQTFKKVEHQIL